MKTLIIVPTAGEVTNECAAALNDQDDRDRSILYASLRPIPLDEDPAKNKSLNILRNRNHIRPMALATDAEWFLWVDSDVVLPPHALSALLKTKKKLVGGWYKKLVGDDWVAGHFTSGDIFLHFKEPQKKLIRVDMLGLGCCLMHRSVLQKVPFRGGTDEYCQDEAGNSYYIGQCTAFCRDAAKAGFDSSISPDVICAHIPQRVLQFK